jgi:potassium efflux system protein
LLITVVLVPLLIGSWGIFAADMLGVLQNIMFGIQIGGVIISPTVILTAIIILLVGILLTRWLQSWLDTRLLPRTTLDPGLQNSVSTIVGYIGVIGAALLALTQVGLDFQQITIVAGALSIGIGFGLQSVVSNFVSGLILLAERPIRVGDVINVKGEEGKVQRIHVRATEIETGDNASLIIPNSELITGTVKNWTHTNTLKRIAVKVGVDYDSDVQKVRDILLEIAKSQTKLATSPAPQALITGFGDNAINFELSGVVRNIGDGGVVKSNLYYAILTRFREEGIVIPRPLVRVVPPPPEAETLGE